MRWQAGEREFSTCLDLALPVIHDVNGWYSTLQVSPRASRREIARAYAEGNGQDDPWKTHCFTQLLDRSTRLAYDRCRMGTRFWDENEELSARRALLGLLGNASAPPDTLSRSLDNHSEVREADHTAWGHYSPSPAHVQMQQWRTALASAAHARQLHRTISVGYHLAGPPWRIHQVDGLTVLSLHCSTAPCSAVANDVLDMLAHPYPTQTDGTMTTPVDDAADYDFEASYGGEVALEKSKHTGGGQFADRIPFFSCTDGETVLVRFLSDAVKHPDNPRVIPWITVDQHNRVPTKAQPSDYKGDRWPKFMGSVCRNDKAFKARYPDGCPIDNAGLLTDEGKKVGKPSARTWALVILREEVYDNVKQDDGSTRRELVGVKTKMRDVTDRDNNKIGETPDIRQMNMGWKNFFASLNGLAARYKTVLNRDIEITRRGSGTDTLYTFAPLDIVKRTDDSIFDLRTLEELERFEATIPATEQEIDGKKVKVPGKIPDLRKCVVAQVNDDYYDRWFEFNVKGLSAGDLATQSQGQSSQSAQPSAPKVSDEDTKAKMAALRERITTRGAAPAQTPEPEPEVDPEPVAAATGPRSFD